jgi:hypothetical protein
MVIDIFPMVYHCGWIGGGVGGAVVVLEEMQL